MSTLSLSALIEKTSDYDKDERYMATNDLCNALSKDVKIDESMEKKICAAILKQLGDTISYYFDVLIYTNNYYYCNIFQTILRMTFNQLQLSA